MKIFQCDMLTTNQNVVKACDGGLYPECNFCTLNLHTEMKVLKRGGKYRPPLVVIDDIEKDDNVIKTKEALKKCMDGLYGVLVIASGKKRNGLE